MKCLHHIQCVFCSITAVNHNRKLYFPGQLQLTLEPFFLNVVPRFIPVIIEPDFTHGHDLRKSAHLFQPGNAVLLQFSHLIGMDAYGAIDKWILLCQSDRSA